MTGMDRRRFTWSARSQGNRILYSLAAGWLVWFIAQPTGWVVSLVVAVVAYAALTLVLNLSR